jgi:ABC-type transport system involved in multi-copper enzyme maturation permease subunit
MALAGFGPVFVSECVTAARRWQTYAGRAAYLAVLLVSLTVVWGSKLAGDPSALNLSKLAQVGESFFYAIAGTQLVLVLLAAPAYTAGAVCLDRARGTLAHVLVTDLSAAEIILGKLGSRLLPVLGLVVAGLPVLALATLLGGIVPQALFGSFLVTVGVGVAGCALALALSVWGNRPHEVLLGAYGLIAVLVLAWPAWKLLPSGWGAAPAWLEKTNPFWLAFAPYIRPQGVAFGDYLCFLGGCVVLTAVLTLLATLTLRRSARREGSRGPRRRRPVRRGRTLYVPSLDFNPVLWRELNGRRSSRWLRVVWTIYGVACIGASVLALVMGGGIGREMGAYVNAFQFSIGLLLVSVTSVTALFEERVRGSLDVLLATPLPTSSIFWGKWWGAYRTAILVTILPALLAFGFFVKSTAGGANTARLLMLLVLLLLIPLMLAYGALVTSLGLALATWVRRFGVAVGLSVTAYVLLAGGSVLLLLALEPANDALRGMASVSPWYGVGEITYEVGKLDWPEGLGWKFAWLIVYAVAAVALALTTLATFDRCMGRVEGSDRAERPPPRLYPRRVA